MVCKNRCEHAVARPGRVLHGFVVLVVASAVAVTCVPAQSAHAPQKTTARGSKGAGKKAGAVRVDSAAAARADSVRNAAAARALADSVQRHQDSLARVHADSLRAFRYRKIQNDAFVVGERLVFDVNYGFITAGEAAMWIPSYDSIAGRACYRINFTVNSLPSFSWIYRVEDRYTTFIDAEAIAPLRFEQHVREGSYSRDFWAEFDQPACIARTSEGNYPIPPYVHDIMSAFYYARTFDYSGFKPGDMTVLYNFYKDKSYELGVKFLGRQDLEVAAGTFRTLVVEPLVKEGGLFKSEGRIVIWLTDDERKIPVRVNTKVIVGSIDVELREYSGLAGPLRSKTN